MRRLTAALVLLAGVSLSAHELFFRLDTYFVAPGATVSIPVYSGTFVKNENAITRDRLTDLSVTTSAGRVAIDRAHWSEREPMSTLTLKTGAAGTYLIGAAIKPKMLALDGKAFNDYLKEEGLDAILAARTKSGRLNEGSRERYSKYLTAVLQVGGPFSDATVAKPLGYAAEIVPQANPARLTVGSTLRVRCLVDGKPVSGQIAFAGGLTGAKGDQPMAEQRLVADANGIATVKITATGRWYVHFVSMREVTGDAEANYESKWSTLTFGVGTPVAR